MRVLCTGGAGFVGAHFVEHLFKNTDWDIIILDKLNYASKGYDRIREIELYNHKKVLTLAADFTQPISDGVAREIGEVDYIVHLGAESHIDRSITHPDEFVVNNVVGTMHMLQFARKLKNLRWFVMFSTDEVYGPAPNGVFFKETDRYNATNPYSASKAAAEQITFAYSNTFGIPAFVMNSMNIFGERQHPEKFIPLVIRKVLSGERLIIHSDSTRTISGSRHYLHARNVADSIVFLLENAGQRESYNIVGEEEISNLNLARHIAKVLHKKLNYEMVDFHSSRPGHDLRYALDGGKMKNMGWEQPKALWDSLEKTILWYMEHKQWLKLQ